MNSALYKATVMHNRLEPKPHRFHYNVFMFYLDLDELDIIAKKFHLISRNKFNVFSFRDKEHLRLSGNNGLVKEQIVEYLKQHGFNYTEQRIMLLTNLNVLGYNFNPVSFYFVTDQNGKAECAVAEVSNTFREMKLFFLGTETLKDGKFHLRTRKYFYVSPFIDHDADFDFALSFPEEKLNIRIDDYKNEKRFFISTLTGQKKELSSTRLFGYFFRFPLITIRVITLIHWNALLLWLKKIPFHKKAAFPELQKDVMNKYKKP
jgi:DUF1365 family protein